jgi:hypothetical protein
LKFHHYGVSSDGRKAGAALRSRSDPILVFDGAGFADHDVCHSSAAAIDYGLVDIVRVIQSIRGRHFYKSMTADANPLAWQDVYHVPDGGSFSM